MIAREGLAPTAATLAVAVVVTTTAGPLWAAPLWLVLTWMLTVFFERRPRIPARALAVVSPFGGRVVSVRSVTDPWLERPATRIRVALPFPGVGVVRSPVEGKVRDLWTSPDAYDAPASTPSASGSPNCYALWLHTDEGDDVVFAVSSVHPLSRLRLDSPPGERAGQGLRSGFVYFATYADVLVPEGTRVEVEAGARVRAAETVLATLSR